MPPVNGVGEPCAGEPHARFDAAGAGNGAPGHGHAAKRPAGETRGKVAAGPHAGQRHRASPRPYLIFRRGINSGGQTAAVTLGYVRDSRYQGTVYPGSTCAYRNFVHITRPGDIR